jgi:RNA polymerase sigma-70 factor (ECF subfamily)
MSLDEAVVQLFKTEYPRLFRFLDRLSGDPDLAADLAQEAFVRLYRRGSLPDEPTLWLVTVGLNLFRNTKATAARRLRLLARGSEAAASREWDSDPADSQAVAAAVRATLDRLPARERELLLLRAEGYSYREMAVALRLNEASIGTLLARAKHAFRLLYEGADASR